MLRLKRAWPGLAATAIAALLIAACGAPQGEAPGAAEDPAARAAGEAVAALDDLTDYANPDALVDTEWVLAHLDDPAVRLIDVSARRESYERGHLPGAQFVAWNADLTNADHPVNGVILTRDALAALMTRLGVANEHAVVFYDDADNLYAARAYWVMRYYQHEDVRVYNGGSKKWVADGQALVTGTTPVAPTSYVAGEPDPEIATDWDLVVERIGDPSTMYCDVRSPDEHTGADVRAERGGHVPGSVNIEWRQTVGDDGTFLDAQSLAGLYQRAGFTPDKEIITYCQSGVRAAHTWFVLSQLLGYPNVRNYDGSWAEYGNRADSPIE